MGLIKKERRGENSEKPRKTIEQGRFQAYSVITNPTQVFHTRARTRAHTCSTRTRVDTRTHGGIRHSHVYI